MAKNTKTLTVLVTEALHAKLEKAAEVNGRSVSGEARYAISLYLKETDGQA